MTGRSNLLIYSMGFVIILIPSSCNKSELNTEQGQGLQVSMQAANTDEETAISTNKSLSGYYGTKMVDPVTALAVVEGGLKVAIQLKSLFGKKDDGVSAADIRAIKQDLKVVKDQNAKTHALLARAIDILNNLGVIIKAGTQETIQTLIKIQLESNITAFYQTWQASLDGGATARRQATSLYKNYLFKSHDLGLQLMQSEVWGYAPYQAVGQNMMVEFWLRRKLHNAPQYIRESAKAYEGYFSRVLSPDVPTSVTAQLFAAKAQAARLDPILAEADAYVATNPISILEPKKEISRTKLRNGWRVTYADIVRTIKGNRKDGYQLEDFQQNVVTVDEIVHHEGGDVGGRGGDVGGGSHGRFKGLGLYVNPSNSGEFEVSIDQAEDPVNKNDLSLPGRVTYWNAVRNTYITSTANAELLTKAEQTAQEFYQVAKAAAQPASARVQ